MPDGYINAMQIFNNLLKLLFASLHEHLKRMPECRECFDNLLSTISQLQELGFVIHSKFCICTNTKSNIFRL